MFIIYRLIQIVDENSREISTIYKLKFEFMEQKNTLLQLLFRKKKKIVFECIVSSISFSIFACSLDNQEYSTLSFVYLKFLTSVKINFG